jgi:hypothetical protein
MDQIDPKQEEKILNSLPQLQIGEKEGLSVQQKIALGVVVFAIFFGVAFYLSTLTVEQLFPRYPTKSSLQK